MPVFEFDLLDLVSGRRGLPWHDPLPEEWHGVGMLVGGV